MVALNGTSCYKHLTYSFGCTLILGKGGLCSGMSFIYNYKMLQWFHKGGKWWMFCTYK